MIPLEPSRNLAGLPCVGCFLAMTEPALGKKPVFALLMRVVYATAFVLPAFGAQAAAVLTTLHEFQAFPYGARPNSALIKGGDGNFYGTTSSGGTNNAGTLFKISASGALTTLYSFGGNDAAGPNAGMVPGGDGNFYGVAGPAGTNSHGTVFQYTTNGVLTTLGSLFLANDPGDIQGIVSSEPIQGIDGNVYVTTTGVDVKGTIFGTVFKISANGALTSLYSFTGGNDGGGPSGLVQGKDGNFYGTTQGGGAHGGGTVFTITTNGALTTLYSFTGTNDGAYPEAVLVQGGDGNFYGTTYSGGSNNYGTVFKITANGALTTLHSFTGEEDGANPGAGLVQGRDGTFYGTTEAYAGGSVFKMSADGTLTTLAALFPLTGRSGFNPFSSSEQLVQGSDGNLYGTTTDFGGSEGPEIDGAIFKLTTNGGLAGLSSYSLYFYGGMFDLPIPSSGLVQGRDGSFYGTTFYGGQGGAGTIFKLTIMPEFQTVALTNGTLSLTWSTEAGATYQLQYNADLSAGNWINLNGPVTATGATLTTTDITTNGPQRFYRLAISP